jgi:murein DD-endopeptidase MepM/ murein hydrolase activator NlpD
MRKLVHLLAAASLLAPAGLARHARRTREPDSVRVKPSESIDRRIDDEVAKAENILAHLSGNNLLDSPYLVSAIYYHDGFLSSYPAGRKELDPSARIVARISRLLTPDLKREYVALLSANWWSVALEWGDERPVLPVVDAETGRKRRRRQPHPNALDLFVPEGAPVHSVTQGLVILAEGGWREGDPFSSSSLRGGNSIIVFSPDQNRFYRYCHLESADVAAGSTVSAGQQIGSVGHTGFNASRKGHGRHLHFEINEFDGRGVRALDKNQLQAFLRGIAEAEIAGHPVPAALVSRTANRP